jgi:hypothetical protein
MVSHGRPACCWVQCAHVSVDTGIALKEQNEESGAARV